MICKRYWNSEVDSIPRILAGANYSVAELQAWALDPLNSVKSKMCLAGDALSPLSGGWTEGAAESAHRCLRDSPVFASLVTDLEVTGWETCKAFQTTKVLSKADNTTSFDMCLALKYEYVLRDLYLPVYYCYGPSVYDYPTLPELLGSVAYATTASWVNITTSVVPNVQNLMNRVHREDRFF